jgi:sec-independent protein translocase protein TatA
MLSFALNAKVSNSVVITKKKGVFFMLRKINGLLFCLAFDLHYLCKNYQRFKKMFGIGTQEILIIALIILLLFGGKKIPELMRGLGKGVKSFKEGMNDKDDVSETIESSKDQKKDESSKE